MKKTTNYLVLFFCSLIAAVSFSSCINDDNNDYTIDVATQKKYMTTISMLSPYANNARLYYESGYNTVKYDSIKGNNVYCQFRSDSTMTIKNFPICKLDSAVKVISNDTQSSYRKLFDAIHNSTSTVNITGRYCVPYSNWATSNGYQYLIGASALFKVTYDGEEHTVLYAFDSTQSYGFYSTSDLSNGMSLVLARIYLDYKDEKNPGTQLNSDYWRKINIVLTKK